MEIDATVRSDILDAMANGVFVVDVDATVLVWNRWMVEHSGIAADIAIGRPLREVFPGVAGTRFEHALQQALSHRLAGLLSPSLHAPVLPLYRNAEDRGRDERMQQLLNLTPIRLASVAGCAVLVQDVTAAVLRERRLREQAQELGRSNEALQTKLDEVQALQARLIDMQRRDALTGLYNRSYLNEVLERELTAARHAGRPLSLVLVDIDELKKINTAYGEQAGDEVIRSLGQQLAGIDLDGVSVGRYGGEEFLAVLPGVAVEAAVELAQGWRRHFEQSSLAFGSFPLKATCSMGVAGYPQHGKTAEDLTQYASFTAYLGKDDGLNRVSVFNPDNSSDAAPLPN